jgi:hypothetical protein
VFFPAGTIQIVPPSYSSHPGALAGMGRGSAVIVRGRSTAAHSVFLPAAEVFRRPHWERAIGQAFPALQPYGRLALRIQSRSFNSGVAFFIASKSPQLMDPLGEISPVPLKPVMLDNTSPKVGGS